MYQMLQPYFTTIVIILLVILLLVAAILVFKSFNSRVRGRKGSRLGISEYYELDATRRLVLLRRDDMEHLVILGGAQDIVIESGIPTAQALQPQIPQSEPPMRAPPRPAVFGSTRPPLRPVPPGFDPQNGM